MIDIPFELYDLLHKVYRLSIGALAINAMVVGLMSYALTRMQREAI